MIDFLPKSFYQINLIMTLKKRTKNGLLHTLLMRRRQVTKPILFLGSDVDGVVPIFNLVQTSLRTCHNYCSGDFWILFQSSFRYF